MEIQINDLTKVFKTNLAINKLNCTIPSGELIAILGPSGCGKSTFLNMLSGIVETTSGEILFNGKNVTHEQSHKRGVGMVFQNYALYPHMTVMDNIGFPLEVKKMKNKAREKRVTELAEIVNIGNLLKRKPSELSGGQQQRVAIARALAKNPEVLLLDEPLSNLDAKLRIEMREEIRRIQKETKVTTLFVTHDQEEASAIADSILLLNNGTIQQFGSAKDLYHDPQNAFVANFFGVPTINEIAGKINEGAFWINDKGIKIMLNLPERVPEGQQVTMAIRPENISIDEENPLMMAKVDEVYMQGKDNLVILDIGFTKIRRFFESNIDVKSGDRIPINFKSEDIFLFDTESGERYL